MDYRKLKLKIKEHYDVEPQIQFAKDMGMSYTAVNQRLNNAIEWKTPEIVKACEVLKIPLTDAHLYFFKPKVEEI